MIERDLDVPAGIDAVRAVGTLTPHDYVEVVVPLVDRAVAEHRGLRILCVVDEAFTGMTPAAMWEDVRLGLTAMRRLEGCAVVSDLRWVRETTRVAAFFLPGRVEVFGLADREEALRWLADLPGTPVDVHLRAGEGVIVVDVDHPLRREDVDVIAAEVDSWLSHHPSLPGLVLHARHVPGWENLSGLVHHLRFVAGHQRRIRRLALAVDGPAIELVAIMAGGVLHPEVGRFPPSELDEAIRWAAAAPVEGG